MDRKKVCPRDSNHLKDNMFQKLLSVFRVLRIQDARVCTITDLSIRP